MSKAGDELKQIRYAQVLESHGDVLLRYKDGTETTLSQLLAAERSQLLERVLALPVMKDDRDYSHDNADEPSIQVLVAASTACNELRAELRAAIRRLQGEGA